MKSNLLNTFSDPDFRLRAFSDYCEDKAKAYSDIMALFTISLDLITEDEDGNSVMPMDSEIDQLCKEYGLNPDANFTTNEGYIASIRSGIRSYLSNQVKVENLEDPSPITVTNAIGDVVHEFNNVDELMDSMKSSLHSITCLCAANAAFLAGGVADKLSVFRDRISKVFSNAYFDFSASNDYFSSLLTEATSTDQYLTSVFEKLNVDGMAEDRSTVVPLNSDVYQFTGSSPMGPLNFSNLTAAVGTVANVGAKIVQGIGSVLWKGAKWLYNKASKFVTEIVADPYDIKRINKDISEATETIDGYCYQYDINDSFTISDGLVGGLSLGLNGVDKYVTGNSFTLKLITGEIFINKLEISNMDLLSNEAHISCTLQIKPKPIRREIAWSILDLLLNAGYVDQGVAYRASAIDQTNVDAIVSQLSALTSTFSDIYYDIDSSEKDLYLGFNLGLLLTLFILKLAGLEQRVSTGMSSEFFVETNIQSDFTVDDVFPVVDRAISNLDFMKAASGYHNDKFDTLPEQFSWLSDSQMSELFYPTSYALISTAVYDIFSTYALDRFSNPDNWCFIPFRVNKEQFSVPQFRIATDVENKDVCNKFLTAVVIVAAAIAAVAVGTTVAKVITKKLTMRRNRLLDEATNKQWNGIPLTKKEKKRLWKSYKRSGAASKASSGLLSSPSIQLSESNDSEILTQIKDALL